MAELTVGDFVSPLMDSRHPYYPTVEPTVQLRTVIEGLYLEINREFRRLALL